MVQLFRGDALTVLKSLPDNSVHLCITDPPYFIDGLGDEWDGDKVADSQAKAGVIGGLPVGMKFDPEQGKKFQTFMHDISKEIYRILVPGAFYISFSQARLYHRLGIAVEDAGFEIRDMLAWKYEGQAKAFTQDHFVRKMKISDEEKERIIADLGGRKTPQLKPQMEPMTLAQKPREGTFVDNWLKWHTGLVDVSQSLDGMFPGNIMEVKKPTKIEKNKGIEKYQSWVLEDQKLVEACLNELRKDMFAVTMLLRNDIVWNTSWCGSNTSERFLTGIRSIIEIISKTTTESIIWNSSLHLNTNESIRGVIETITNNGSNPAELADFIRKSKPTTTDEKTVLALDAVIALFETLSLVSDRAVIGNNHVTVKPTALITHLVKLFSTHGQTVLDPFLGSGSHGVAAVGCGRDFIGIERNSQYFEIASNRINNSSEIVSADETNIEELIQL